MLERSGEQVQRLGGATREDDFPCFLGMDEIGNGLARMFVGLGCLLAQVMHPTVNVAVLVQVIVAFTLDNAQRFLRSGGIVKIDQGLAVDLLIKDGELLSYFVDVTWFQTLQLYTVTLTMTIDNDYDHFQEKV